MTASATTTPHRVKVCSTLTNPELVPAVPIQKAKNPPTKRTVVMSFTASKDELTLADVKPGDLLKICVELAVTTDVKVHGQPGQVGRAYAYSPKIQAVVVLANDMNATQQLDKRAHSIAKSPEILVSHDRHHQVVTFNVDYAVPKAGLPFQGPLHINVALCAWSEKASGNQDECLLVGENEGKPEDAAKEKKVDQDLAGIRVIRIRDVSVEPKPISAWPLKPFAIEKKQVRPQGVPVEKKRTIILRRELNGLRKNDQLFIRSEVRGDARGIGTWTRFSGKLYLSEKKDAPDDKPSDWITRAVSWEGNLSRENGSNLDPRGGTETRRKYGVARMNQDIDRPLYVCLFMVCSTPLLPVDKGGDLAIAPESFLEVTRVPAAQFG